MRNNGRNRTSKSRKIKTLDEKINFKYLGMLEVDTIKQAKVKEKNKKRET